MINIYLNYFVEEGEFMKYLANCRTNGQIINPLSNDDLALFIEDEYTKEILNSVNIIFSKTKFGNYLISGEKGVGKTTLINLVLNDFRKNYGNYFYFSKNDYDDMNSIYKSFIEQVDKIKEDISSSDIKKLVENASVLLKGNIQIKDSVLSSTKKLTTEKKGRKSEGILGFILKLLEFIFSFFNPFKLKFSISKLFKPKFSFIKESTDESASEEKRLKETTITREVNLDDNIKKIIEELSNKYKITFVFDDLNRDIIDKYSNIIKKFDCEEKKSYCFFIVDDSIYKSCIIEKQNNFVVNYRDSFYLPRMSFQGLMRFIYTLFNKREKSIAMIDFWNTLGNRKAIISAEDTQKCNRLYVLVINFKILSIFIKVFDSMVIQNDVTNFKRDKFITSSIKIIEMIVSVDTLANEYSANITSMEHSFKDIMNMLTEEEYIKIDTEGKPLSLNRKKILDNEGLEFSVQDFLQNEEKYNGSLSNSITPTKYILIGDNDPYAYSSTMLSLIFSNIRNLLAVVVLEQPCEWNSLFQDSGKVFSAVAIIKTPDSERTAFYNSQGSYSFEYSNVINTFIKELHKVNIDVYYYESNIISTGKETTKQAIEEAFKNQIKFKKLKRNHSWV